MRPPRLEVYLVDESGCRYRIADHVADATAVDGLLEVPIGTRAATMRVFLADDGTRRVLRLTPRDPRELEASMVAAQLGRAAAPR